MISLSRLRGGGGGSGTNRLVTAYPATAISQALQRAQAGLGWDYPCLIWLADYLYDETDRDPAAEWRGEHWTEKSAKLALAQLALGGIGRNAIERALDVVARRDGWIETEAPQQGAIMVGALLMPDGESAPAIFDGQNKWICSIDGRGWTVTGHRPERIWEVPR